MATWFTSSIRLGGSSDDWGNSRHRRGGMCCMQMRLAEFCISIYPTRTLKRWTLQSGLGRRFSKRLWLFLIVILGVRCQVRCSHSPSCLPQEKEEELKRQEDRHLRQLLIHMIRQVTWNLRNMDSERQAKSGKYCTYMYVYYATQWLKHVEPYFSISTSDGTAFQVTLGTSSKHQQTSQLVSVVASSSQEQQRQENIELVERCASQEEQVGDPGPWLHVTPAVLTRSGAVFEQIQVLNQPEFIWHNLTHFPFFSIFFLIP